MKVSIPHQLTPARARKKLESLVEELRTRYAHLASDIEERWDGNILHVGIKAKGMSAKGTVELKDGEVVIAGKLPLMARPFESKIKSAIATEAKRVLS